ncbi:MAG TPA: FAD-dependent oxidoreductase [Caulobacterales bacterium]|nr:FAD-dependent oxidoreductase [Caulobacterales bacterium]
MSAAPLHVVIVGASLAGLRTAEALRAEGYQAALTLIGEETHEPYDRPPLSKQVLSGWVDPYRTRLPRMRDVSATWRLGVRAVGLDRERNLVRLESGEDVPFDRLVIATGTRARPWPFADQAALKGVHVLRTSDDAAALLNDLQSARRVLVVGAGFTGSEVASACRARGLPVTVVEINEAPLLPQLGRLVAHYARDRQQAAGVDLRCGTTVTALIGRDGRLIGAELSDGQEIEADVAVVCLGAIRNTEWLAGADLDISPLGVRCDEGGRVLRANGQAEAHIFACGDVARAPSALAGGDCISVEHWGAALEQAAIVGANIVKPGSAAIGGEPPHFWSMQFGSNFKSVGLPPLADEIALSQGSLESGRFVVLYGRAGKVVGAVAVNQAQWIMFYERVVKEEGVFPPAHRVVDTPADNLRQPARFTNAPQMAAAAR